MNVSQQNTDKLNAVISIEVTKADYQESVNKALRTYGQKANIPGFRKGKVSLWYTQQDVRKICVGRRDQ